MARSIGVVNVLKTNFENYSYFINGVGGIGKTTLAYEIGKKITGSNEGTLIITCGEEPKPEHINGAFYEYAPTFDAFIRIAKELVKNRSDFPYTKFIAIDSVDEFTRITQNYVIKEWNDQCDIKERAKTIKQAYKGYQAGEDRTRDLMIEYLFGKLESAGYKLLLIGHTKLKTKEDIFSGISYEQITCNLDNKYYNALKDKVNLVATCYNEKTIENIEEKKNAFTKKMDKVGNLTSEKRVIVFRDDDMAIDTKSHFKYIVPKVEFGVDNFINAVTEALEKQASEGNITTTSTPKVETPIIEETPIDTDETPIEETIETVDKSALMNDIRTRFKSASDDTKKQIKAILKEKGSGKLDDSLEIDVLNEISAILDDEV